jgi:hypothetical protein
MSPFVTSAERPYGFAVVAAVVVVSMVSSDRIKKPHSKCGAA